GFAVDISGWNVGGGVSFTFRPGTVVPAGGSLYLSPNVNAFRTRASGPRGGQGLFVQGDYRAQLNAWGETVTLTDDTGPLVVNNAAAFTARYGSGLNIAGEYTGSLDNAGETLRLEDAVGEKILEFAYDSSWYPLSDGLGFSLVIMNENVPWYTWGDKESWR